MRGPERLDVATLRARMLAARGPLPSRERVIETSMRGGLSGALVTTRDGDDFRRDNTYGALVSAAGEFRGQAWHRNENGETVLERPEPGNATHEATIATVSRVAVPLDAWVHPEALKDAILLGAGQLQFRGVGGTFATQPYHISAVRLGNLNFKGFTVFRVMSAASYSRDEDGVISVGFLEIFTLYIDYGNSMLYFVPNAAGRSSRP